MKPLWEKLKQGLATTMLFAPFYGEHHYNRAKEAGNLFSLPKYARTPWGKDIGGGKYDFFDPLPSNTFFIAGETTKDCYAVKKHSWFKGKLNFHTCAKMSATTFNDIHMADTRLKLAQNISLWNHLRLEDAKRTVNRLEDDHQRQEWAEEGESWKLALPEHAGRKNTAPDPEMYEAAKRIYAEIHAVLPLVEIVDRLMLPHVSKQAAPETPLLNVDKGRDKTVDPLKSLVTGFLTSTAREKFFPDMATTTAADQTRQVAHDFMMGPKHNNN